MCLHSLCGPDIAESQKDRAAANLRDTMHWEKMLREPEQGDLSRLLSRCRKGDARAWGEMVDRFQAFVYSIPKRMGLGEEDAADVFQATFIALHRSLDRLESAAALPKWLAVTASREAIRVNRLKQRAPISENQGADERTLDEIVADEDRNAEEIAVSSCEAHLIRVAIARLNDRCAKLLKALYLDNDPAYQEISDRLRIPMGAIGPTRARCLDKLRRELAEEGFFE